MRKYKIIDAQSLRLAIEDAHAFLTGSGLDETSLFHSKLVFNELASNAVKHTKDGGEVSLWVWEEKVEVLLVGGQFTMPKTSVCSSVYEESGRGLFLIDSVCAQREETQEGVKITIIREK